MTIGVNADAQRISQMFTVAEYLETWICHPASDAGSHVAASRAGDDYRLDFYGAGRLNARITGSYLVCRHRKMLFTWRGMEAPPSASVVDIRVRGNFGSSILELRHSGLASPAEHSWHAAMWGVSLERLVRLMKNSHGNRGLEPRY